MSRRFFLVPILAAAAWLFTPSPAHAGFAVQIKIDGVVVDTIAGDQDPITGLWSASKTKTYGDATNYVKVSFAAESNNPGTSAGGYVLDTTTNIINGGTAATTHNIVISAVADQFSQPGVSGDKMFMSNRLTSIGGTGINGPNAANLDVYGVADPDSNAGTNNNVRTAPGSYYSHLVDGVIVYDTPEVSFIRGAAYNLTSVIDMTLGAGKTGQITTSATVVAPAPSGLLLAFTAVPVLVGMRRRLLRSNQPVA